MGGSEEMGETSAGRSQMVGGKGGHIKDTGLYLKGSEQPLQVLSRDTA